MDQKDKTIKHISQAMVDLIKRSSGQANVLTIPRWYIDLTGDIKSALFLSQCMYWYDRSEVGEGWFYKSIEEWKQETGLSRKEIDRIKVDLSNQGLLEYELRMTRKGSQVVHFRANVEGIIDLLMRQSEQKQEAVVPKGQVPVVPKGQVQLHQRDNSLKDINFSKDLDTEITDTSSSSYPLQKNQEEEEEEVYQELSGEVESLLEELGVFENRWDEVRASKWTHEEIIKMGHQVLKGDYDNPAGIFLYRLHHRKPKHLVINKNQLIDDPTPIFREIEKEVPDQVEAAYLMTLDKISGEVSSGDYKTWIESIEIKDYNGSLILSASNRFVLEKLQSLKLTEKVWSEYFSSFLGKTVPVKFVVG